ncbi:MAG: PEGA domain-containing protein, partial [Thermoanaerobaculia bacterium]
PTEVAATAGRPTALPAEGSRRGVAAAVAAGLLVIGAAAAGYFLRAQKAAPGATVPAPAPAATAAATVPAELPSPEIGVDARPPTPVPATVVALPTAAPAPKRFEVQFSSIPPSTLYVDGRLIGPSVPARRVPLEEGTHRYRFEAPGLPPYEQGFRVGPSGAPPVAYQFPVGTLVLQTDPSWIGASIIVDGKYKATVQSGAERVRLSPGTHRVIVLREGFSPANREVSVPNAGEVIWAPAPAVPLDPGG